ncbi:MAG TPA: hypothetical protein VMJ32_15855 [Pirellulales bacterium]|nr:hypothetical protein [Pirellulales bacterium]
MKYKCFSSSPRLHFTAQISAALVINLYGLAAVAFAGGGPENVLLVVNSADAGSKTIANHYVQLRNIPPGNVVYLDPKTWNGSDARIDVDAFREKIIRPLVAEIESRKLQTQIDYIIYSSGFPWAINFSADLPPAARSSQLFQNPEGSLSGLTYLLYEVAQKNVGEYAGFTSNNYMRLRDQLQGKTYEIPVGAQTGSKGLIPGAPDTGPKIATGPVNESSIGSHGFRSWYGWDDSGDLEEAGGKRYMLSTVLGVTYGRGNSLNEIISYLQRSAAADGTFPQGTIYFMDNADIRSQTRKPAFQFAVDLLRRLGVKAEIMSGALPQNRPDVQGLMTGVSDFNWPASGSAIRPGAICENFTSFGGIFDANAGQTPLSVFLKYGAAASSGTVAEPFAFQNKFPYAMIQVHYARGCSLAEAFYQSVYAPYQLIIVGDPLCRPWANIPQVQVAGLAAGDVLSGVVTIRPTAKLPQPGAVDRFELFLDGVRIDTTNADDPLKLDTTKSSDGYHELRIVGIENSAIESQGRLILPVQFNNYGKTITFETSPQQRVRAGGTIKLFAKAPGAKGVAFYHDDQSHPVAKFAGADGEATVDAALLGEGPVTLQAEGWESGGSGPFVYSTPITLTIEGPEPREESAAAKTQSRKAKFEQ